MIMCITLSNTIFYLEKEIISSSDHLTFLSFLISVIIRLAQDSMIRVRGKGLISYMIMNIL